MAELEVREKYTNSYRLDHPNFGDVLKTDYARGVIADFKIDYEGYQTVLSLIKVEGDWGESDYIPLFYHPKAQYWDVGEHQAQDINEGGKYFEKAWKSFRVDDEVIVIIQDGTPFFAIGFADGVPRIGEEVLKTEYGSGHWWATEKLEQYSDGDKGPDELDLGLLSSINRIEVKSETKDRDPEPILGPARLHHGGELIYRVTNFYLSEILCDNDQLEVRVKRIIEEYGIYEYIENLTTKIYRYLVVIGPHLYVIEQTSLESVFRWGEEIRSLYYDWYQNNSWQRHTYPTQNGIPYGGCIERDFPEVEGYADAWIAERTQDQWWNYENSPLPEDGASTRITMVYKAVYTPERYEQAKTYWEQGAQPEGFIEDIPMLNLLRTNDPNSPWPYPPGSLGKELEDAHGDVELEFLVRPHTKEELQAAGLWPEL